MQTAPDIFARISSKMNLFSKKERAIASYVLTHPHDIPHLAISDLAEKCDASDATIFRFCKQLELRGYPELRMQVMQCLSNSSEVALASDTAIESHNSLNEIMDKLLSVSQSALARVQQNLNETDIDRAVTLLCKADYVQFVGFGNMLLSAMEARIRFMRLSYKFHCDIDHQLQGITAALLPSNSLVVFFSYSGSTNDILEVARLARQRNAKIILISRYAKSELADLADCTIVCDVIHDVHQNGLLTFKMGLLYIIEVLYAEYCRRNPEEAERNRRISSMTIGGRVASQVELEEG